MLLAEKLAAWSHDLAWSDLDRKTVDAAKLRILDSIGCAFGGMGSKPAEIARRVALEAAPGRARIWGGGESAVALAAFANGTMIRYLDYNDTYISSKKEISHPSDNIACTLTLAGAEERSGKELILATVLAYELQCRLSDAFSLRARGWDHVVYGLLSSGLAAAKLMGLSKARAEQAINLTITSYLSTRQVREGAELSMWKACAFSNAARNAIFAAQLAKAGMTGPAVAFEGKYGFWKMASGKFSAGTRKFGRPFKINETWIKNWPAETHAQSAIEAAIELGKEIGEAGKIERVIVETHKAGYDIIGTGREKWQPKTRETADHSLPYIVAAALMDGKVDASTFAQKRLNDRKLLRLVSKVKVKESAELSRLYPRAAANRVSVRTSGGRLLSKKVVYQKGHSRNPMTWQDVEKKFLALSKSRIEAARANRIVSAIKSLEKSGASRLARLL